MMKTFYDGQLITAADMNANFSEVPKLQRGTVSGSSTVPADGTNSYPVTFPTPFDTAPSVVIVGSDNSRMATESKNITATGFSLAARNVSAAATSGGVNYSWIAVI